MPRLSGFELHSRWEPLSGSSLLNIYFPLSGFQFSLLLIYFRQGPNACSHCGEEWNKPIRSVTIHFQDLRGATSLLYKKSGRNDRSYV